MAPCQLSLNVNVVEKAAKTLLSLKRFKKVLGKHRMHLDRLRGRGIDPPGDEAEKAPNAFQRTPVTVRRQRCGKSRTNVLGFVRERASVFRFLTFSIRSEEHTSELQSHS